MPEKCDVTARAFAARALRSPMTSYITMVSAIWRKYNDVTHSYGNSNKKLRKYHLIECVLLFCHSLRYVPVHMFSGLRRYHVKLEYYR
jgi:hypothetical protein